MYVKEYILGEKFQYFIDEVKNPIKRAMLVFSNVGFIQRISLLYQVVKLAKRYHVVTTENVKKASSLVYLDIWDNEILKYETNPGAKILFPIMRNVQVGTNDSDEFYSERTEVFLKYAILAWLEGRLVLQGPWIPSSDWDNDETKRALALERIKKLVGG